jgi:hypothetical protein
VVIEENDFKLELTEYDRFNLYLLHVVNAKKADKRREEFKIVGYDMRLETCLHKIIIHRIKNSLEVTTLKEYLKEYKKEHQSLKNLAKMD